MRTPLPYLASGWADCVGSATPMKMGGTGTRRQRIQDFRQRKPIPKTENSADLAHYFPENGGDYPPLSQKWGDASPPSPPPCAPSEGILLLLKAIRSVYIRVVRKKAFLENTTCTPLKSGLIPFKHYLQNFSSIGKVSIWALCF